MTDQIAQAAELLRRGELVVFPTETVYGVGANALDAAAVRKIFEVKGRPATSPLIVHVSSLEMARELALEWPPAATRLAERWWPGPLTIVVPKSGVVPDEVTAGLASVGLRMPAHPLALELIGEAGIPVAAPSANRFTELSPSTAEHARRALGDRVAMVLDGGPCRVGIESTVISLAGDGPLLLRPGMISREDLEQELGPLRIGFAGEGAHPAPGMHAKHYSPRTPVLLVDPGDTLPGGSGAYAGWVRPAAAARFVEMPRSREAYAAMLYETLHTLDAEGWDWIAIERTPSDPGWDGVRDRLLRASG